MYKIDILFLDKEFEHDIYELIRAFIQEVKSLLPMMRERKAVIFISGSKSRMSPA